MSGQDDHDDRLERRILEYLETHPQATDTLEGIARFWLSGTCDDREQVERIVTDLVDRGLMRRRLKPDGEWLYLRKPPPSPGSPPEQGDNR